MAELDTYQVSLHIQNVMKAITKEGKESKDLILAEAEAMKCYDKGIAVRELEHKAAGMAVTILKDQAKGDAHELLFDMIVAQKSLKAHWKRLKYLQAQLNGWQSIYRHLDSVVK